jgi:AbrB family looped-hinge helix DNA binding protein
MPSKRGKSKAKPPLTKRAPRGKVREVALAYLTEGASPMSEVAIAKLSSKHQITLPVDVVRRLGLEAGDRLAVGVEEDRIVLRPRPRDWVEYYRGRLRGVYGSSVEEIDEYVRKERESWRGRAERLDS